MRRPTTQYTKAGSLNIAYQVFGEGEFDLVYVPAFVSNVELAWDEPLCARFLTRLASFSRVITFDKRGTGMSDRLGPHATQALEERLDDMLAVLAAADSERPAVLGSSEGGNLAVLFASSYPQRTRALVTAGIFAARIWAEDYPWAPTPDDREREIRDIEATWGSDDFVDQLAPSVAGDAAVRHRLANYFRQSASPGAAAQLFRINTRIDVREALPLIQAPTLVLHRTGDRDANVQEGRYIASRIPNAVFKELPGEDHIPWAGDADAMLDEIESFLTGVRGPSTFDRALSTVLFTDLVSSTATATELGDGAWRALLERHDALVRSHIDRYRGRLIKLTGDGSLATFDGPSRAVECALALKDAVRELGLGSRAGAHTGEIELRGDDIGGVAVHVAARVAAAAEPNEVLVTRTVTDLTSGSRLRFDDRGVRELEGLSGRWQLFTASL